MKVNLIHNVEGVSFRDLKAIAPYCAMPTGVGKRRRSYICWVCLCICGNYTYVRWSQLSDKRYPVNSCGCYKRNCGPKVHGLWKHPLNSKWNSMKKRCYSLKNAGYKDYGARGITVCDEWRQDFKAFYDWALREGWSPGLSLEREDVNGNYSPNNCRWIPKSEQAHNQRKSSRVVYKGEKWNLIKLYNHLNPSIPYTNFYARVILCKWDIDKALSAPIRSQKRSSG